MKKILCYSIATFLSLSQAYSAPSGSLEAACRGGDSKLCNAYVNGMIAGILTEQNMREQQRISLASCLPENLQPRRFIEIFLSFMDRYPEAKNLEAGNVLPESWKRVFCQR